MFSIIGPYFDEEDRVLDLFAGTGGLGIEALSRGAGRAVFVDLNPRSIEVVRRNLEAARLADRAEVYRIDAGKAVRMLERRGEPFSLLFLDPPYAMRDCDERLGELQRRGLAAEGAIAVVEHAADFRYPDEIGGFRLKRYARYGDTALSIYRYGGESHL
jgi:16S rRNA (guanine(966)-N(2))-methyltransferase RsmD